MTHPIRAYNRRDLERRVGYSQAILAGDYLFISGCVSWDLQGNPLHAGNFESQVEAVYADIDVTLKAHGMTASNVARKQYSRLIWTPWIAGESAPRTVLPARDAACLDLGRDQRGWCTRTCCSKWRSPPSNSGDRYSL